MSVSLNGNGTLSEYGRIRKMDKTGLCIPFVTSFNIDGLAYNEGFKNPIGFLPTFNRSSLIRVMTDEKMGVEAEVPPKEFATSPR
jgi:hypothetical protein